MQTNGNGGHARTRSDEEKAQLLNIIPVHVTALNKLTYTYSTHRHIISFSMWDEWYSLSVNGIGGSPAATARLSLWLCPLWFLMNYLFNLSLDLTTVASNTILRYLVLLCCRRPFKAMVDCVCLQ
jgi:hypothetical protein